MRSNLFFIPVFAIVLFWQLFAVYNDMPWLEDFTEWLFLPLALCRFVKEWENVSDYLFVFLIFYTIAYIFRIVHFTFYSAEISLAFETVAISGLILEASRHIKRKKVSVLMLGYFIFIISVNGYLLASHLLRLKNSISSDISFFFYAVYYFNLLVLGICALIYYLNSFSVKSVFFIAVAMTVIFAAVLREMGIFYYRDISVEMAEGILRAGLAVAASLFFVTAEKKMRLLYKM